MWHVVYPSEKPMKAPLQDLYTLWSKRYCRPFVCPLMARTATHCKSHTANHIDILPVSTFQWIHWHARHVEWGRFFFQWHLYITHRHSVFLETRTKFNFFCCSWLNQLRHIYFTISLPSPKLKCQLEKLPYEIMVIHSRTCIVIEQIWQENLPFCHKIGGFWYNWRFSHIAIVVEVV